MVGLSLGAFGLFHAGAQALLTGPPSSGSASAARCSSAWHASSPRLVSPGFATQGWVMFALMPLFALGGIGMPALQSLTTQQVDADNQGKLQGVLASVCQPRLGLRAAVLCVIYFAVKPSWPGLIWLVGGGVYVLALPLILGIRARGRAASRLTGGKRPESGL